MGLPLMKKTARNLSPLAVLTLSACGGTTSTGGFKVTGMVENGPLVDAYVFLDYNGNAIWDGGDEKRVLTNAASHIDGAGSYELTATKAGYTLVALTTEQTTAYYVDTATSVGYGSGIVLQAPEGSSMITPSTTVVKELMAQDTDLTVDAAIAKVAKALGFEGTNLLTYSAHADQTNMDDTAKEKALKVQQSNNKLMATVNSFAAAAEGSGVVAEGKAFDLALNSVVQVLKEKVDTDAVLSFSTDLDDIKVKMKADFGTYASNNSALGLNPGQFDSVANSVETAVGHVVQKIDTIQYANVKVGTTTAEDISDIFSVVKVLATQVGDGAKALKAGNSLSIAMTDATKVTDAMANKAPTDISVTSNFAEDKSDLIIGSVATADVANLSVADTHKYAIVGGVDSALFNITEGGQLSFKAQPDYETMVAVGKETYDVAVQVKDSGGKTFVKTLKIAITNANDAPTVSNAILDQTITEGSALSFQFNTNVFVDVDSSQVFSYAATLSNDTVLPSWLNFDATTRTFSGTPANSDVGLLEVKLTATDSESLLVSDTFSITVTNINDAPTVANEIADKTISKGSVMYFKFDSTVFVDVDASDTLTYAATLADNSALPAWLTFDAAARTFSGTPADSDIGLITVKVKATDSVNATVFDTFNITVTASNAVPTVTSTGVTTSIQDTAYTYTFAATDSDAGDTITYAAPTRPSWLNFDVNTGVLSGVPTSSQVGTHSVVLTATDAMGSPVSQNFTITVKSPLTAVTGTNATFTPVLFAPYELGAVIGSVTLGGSVSGTLTSVDDRVTGKTVFELSGNQLKLGDNYYFDPETKTFANPDLTYFTYESQNWTLDLFNNDDTDNGYYSNTGGPIADASILISDDLFAGVSIVNAPYDIGGQATEAAAKSSTNYIDAILPDTPVVWKTSLANITDQTSAAETVITYSFPGSTAQFAVNYGPEVTGGFKAFNDIHINATRFVLQEYSKVANLKFVEVPEIGTAVGTLRFTFTDYDKVNPDVGGNSWGWAMGPYNQPNGGDVWVDSEHMAADSSWEQGASYNFANLIHEIGHALGLDHPFAGADTLATNLDFVNYTIMSYTQPDNFAAWNGSGAEADYMVSTSPMVYDIAAIQHLYGAAEYNNGNTIYKYDPAKPVSEAIWDSGGTDIFDFSDFTENCSINLAPGGYSTIAFTEWTMTDNLGIAYGAIIENAIGGGGVDTIVGNSAANKLYGGTGAGVKDTLTGNGGADIFVCSLSDATTNLALADIISDFTNGTDFIGLEDRTFSDLSISNSSGDTKIVDTSSNKVLFVLSSVDHTLIESSDFVVTDFV
jgi:hypothetical protein